MSSSSNSSVSSSSGFSGGDDWRAVLCFASREDYVYAGMAFDGKIIRSRDRFHWTDFTNVYDAKVRVLTTYNGLLVAGTEPLGHVYLYDFNTEESSSSSLSSLSNSSSSSSLISSRSLSSASSHSLSSESSSKSSSSSRISSHSNSSASSNSSSSQSSRSSLSSGSSSSSLLSSPSFSSFSSNSSSSSHSSSSSSPHSNSSSSSSLLSSRSSGSSSSLSSSGSDQAVSRLAETGDGAVTAFAEFGGKLYVGTAPQGFVFSYDGAIWRKEFTCYGGGVSAMVATDSQLFVFLSAAETAVVFDGTSWSVAMIAGPAAYRHLTTEPYSTAQKRFIQRVSITSVAQQTASGALLAQDVDLVRPPRPERYVSAAATQEGNLVLAGKQFGGVYLLANGGLQQVAQADEKTVIGLIKLDDQNYLVASPHTLYFLEIT